MQCPLCLSFQFASLQALRDALISCAQRPVSCPLCADSLRGLDKFTAHLFAHLLSGQAAAHGHWLDACAASPEATDDEDSLMTLLRCRETVSENTDDQKIVIAVSASQEAVCEATVSHETVIQGAAFAESGRQEPANNLPGKQEALDQMTVNVTSVEDATASAAEMILEVECETVQSEQPFSAEHDDDPISSKRPFACFRCSKAFRSRGSLLVHMRIAHNAPRTAQLQLVQPALLTQTQQADGPSTAQGKAWECATCHKRFSTKYFLAKHQRLHTGETPYTCTTCGKSFTFQQSLHKHLLYHSAVKPHACPDCGRCFKELSTLANHRRIHSGEKPFPCDTCGKRFRQRVSWLVHRRIHTGALPYQCTSCGQRFRYKVSQRTHKCPAQPPGAVVRAPSDLLARLKAAQSTGAQPSVQQRPQEPQRLQNDLLEDPPFRQRVLETPSLKQGPIESSAVHHGDMEVPSSRIGLLEATPFRNGLLETPSVRHGPLEEPQFQQPSLDDSTRNIRHLATSSIRQGLPEATAKISQQGLLESTLRRTTDFPILRTIDEESLRQLLDSTTL